MSLSWFTSALSTLLHFLTSHCVDNRLTVRWLEYKSTVASLLLLFAGKPTRCSINHRLSGRIVFQQCTDSMKSVDTHLSIGYQISPAVSQVRMLIFFGLFLSEWEIVALNWTTLRLWSLTQRGRRLTVVWLVTLRATLSGTFLQWRKDVVSQCLEFVY